MELGIVNVSFELLCKARASITLLELANLQNIMSREERPVPLSKNICE